MAPFNSMADDFLYAMGTQVVTLKHIQGAEGGTHHPAGTVGVIIQVPHDRAHCYRIRFPDNLEALITHDRLMRLADYQRGDWSDEASMLASRGLFDRVIYRCIVGSRAFGLETDTSDTDRRGIYLPPAELHWSLYGAPEQLESDQTQETYWELQKFLIMALKGNPNILECLYTPLIEMVTPLGQQLLDMREAFLSKVVYQTYNGYVMSQFKRMRADMRQQEYPKPKHVMHLIRLLLSGIHLLRERTVMVDVGAHREPLLAIKRGEMPWTDAEAWRLELHKQFDEAYQTTKLPERPDYRRANEFLVEARHRALEETLP